jgi:hypothetical protein
LPAVVAAVPGGLVESGRDYAVLQGAHPATGYVVHLDLDAGVRLYGKVDPGLRGERYEGKGKIVSSQPPGGDSHLGGFSLSRRAG